VKHSLTPAGALAYQDDRVIVVVTGLRRPSANIKTGDLVQSWVLSRHEAPHDAVRSGGDAIVCGDCPQRPSTGGACYVRVEQAPLSVWHAYQRGGYPVLTSEMLAWARARGAALRIGSYGDPSAVPALLWERLTAEFRRSVGYTHAWRTSPDLRSVAMASVESEEGAREARAAGWRYFRMRSAGSPLLDGEIECPASEGGGYLRTCATCGACDGARSAKDRRASVSIVAHGARVRRMLPVMTK